MKKNMGFADRVLRLLLALVFVTLYFTGVITGTMGLILITLAVVFAGTSFISFCPLYAMFGLSTLRRKSDAAPSSTPK